MKITSPIYNSKNDTKPVTWLFKYFRRLAMTLLKEMNEYPTFFEVCLLYKFYFYNQGYPTSFYK